MSLPLINNPSVVYSPGAITSIVNAKEPGAQMARFGIDQIGEIWQGSRIYQNRMRVITTNPQFGPLAVLNAIQSFCGVVLGNYYVFPLPEIGVGAGVFTASEQDTGSFAQAMGAEQTEEDALQWIVTIDYGPFDIVHQLGNSNVQYASFTPLDFPPVVKWSTAKYHRSYPTDVNGNWFINTAGDPLENPPQREESTQNLRLILWNGTYDEPFAQTFRDTINLDTFLGFSPSYVKCKDIDGERIYTSDYGYVWRIIYDFEIRLITITIPKTSTSAAVTYQYGWQDLVLNLGYRAFGGATGVAGPLAPIVVGGIPVLSPMLLNQDGTCTVVTDRAQVVTLQDNVQLFLTFNNFPGSTFANLNISQTILTENQ